jgi:hypothetical protein
MFHEDHVWDLSFRRVLINYVMQFTIDLSTFPHDINIYRAIKYSKNAIS